MNATFSRIMYYVIAAVLLYMAFSIHPVLGLAAIAGLIFYALFQKRDTFLVKKASEASHRGNHKEALELMERAHKMNPRSLQTQANYAYLLLKTGKIEESGQMLESILANKQAIKLHPMVKMTLALVRWKQDRLEEAVSMLEQLHATMKTTTLYGSLGFLYIERGDLDRALDYNLEAVDYNDTDAVIMDNLLLTYILRKEWAQADETSSKLMALRPKFPEAYYHDGLLKEHFGDVSGAIDRYEEALGKPFTSVSTESRESIEARLEQARAILAGNH